MNGHISIAELRRHGKRPSIIFIDDLPHEPKMTIWTDAEQSIDNGLPATIQIMPTDVIERLGLHCIVGCVIAINGYDKRRIQALVARCRHYRPKQVVASFENEFISR